MPRTAPPMKQVARKRKRSESPVAPSESAEEASASTSGLDSGSSEEDEEEQDADRPRASQWVDEEDEMYDEEEEIEPSNNLRQEMSKLSFGALLKAKRALAQQAQEESTSNSSDEEKEEDNTGISWPEEKREAKERKPKEKRANKHAPMEMSSKRPVSRKRVVVDVAPMRTRDPRFGDSVGEYSADHFMRNYEFLSQLRKEELGSVKENLVKAKKQLASSSVVQRDERRAEVEKLDHAVKRNESAIERTRRLALEREALLKLKRDEREKRSHGKKEWYLKKGDEKRLKLQARFESLSGKEAKKAIEKKRKKIAQREKKSRPFAPAKPGGSSSARDFPVGGGGAKGGSAGNWKRRRTE